MATISASWTESVSLRAAAVLASAATDTNDIDLDNLTADAVALMTEVVFGASADGNVLVEVFGSVDSGTQDDTEPITAFTIEEANNTTKRKTIVIKDVPYIAVKITNNDSADNVTIEQLYAWRNWNST